MASTISREYDAVVIGAGPAGCQCARELARRGRDVLLVERCADFSENDFSSAGTVLDFMSEFGLPQEIVGSYWNKITLVSTGASRTWESPRDLGVVLDFARLRAFLAEDVRRLGGQVLMGHSFKGFKREGGFLHVVVRERRGKSETVLRSRLLVDASGHARCVMRQVGPPSEDTIECLGLEYLIEVPREAYKPKELLFFVGHKWMPKGYSWIFPMGDRRLKVGAGQMFSSRGQGERSLKSRVDMLLKDYLRADGYKVLDVHGGRLVYSRSQSDSRYADGIIAVGDAISAFNPLGGEGIRHGMRSANSAAEFAEQYLSSRIRDFSPYARSMKAYFGSKWKLSLKLSEIFYAGLADANVDRAVRLASRLGTEDLMAILFQYQFRKGLALAAMPARS